MTRRYFLAAGLLSAFAVLAGCTSTDRSTDPVDEPPSTIGRGDSVLSAWRYETAQTVGRLLVSKGDTVALLQPTIGRRRSLEYTAALAMRSARSADLALPPLRDGLFDADEADQVYVSWLVVRQAGSRAGFPTETVRSALVARLRTLAGPVVRGEVELSATYLLARDTLKLLGDRPPAVPAADYCGRLGGARDLISGSVWLRLAAARGTGCRTEDVERVTGFAAERMDDRGGAVTLQTAAEVRAAGDVLEAAHQQPRVPQVCPALLTERRQYGVRTAREPGAYLACADAEVAAGQTPELSEQVVSWLDLLVRTQGKLPEDQRIDALGLLYETQTLKLLQFQPALLASARSVPGPDDSSDVERRLLVAFARGEIAQGTSANVRGAPAMLTAAAALAGGDCPTAGWLAAGVAAISDGADIDEQFRRAVLVAAARRCAPSSLEAAAAAPLAKAAAIEAAAGPESHLLDVWKAAEVRCLLDGRSGLTPDRVRAMLPDYSLANPEFDVSLDSLYASVRLSLIAEGGCAGAFWDL
jgi:hypothetical protein